MLKLYFADEAAPLIELVCPDGTPDAPVARAFDVGELSERLVMAGAIEAQRVLADGTVIAAADANVGSLLGAGFPAWTGSVAQYVGAYPGGVHAFVSRADELATRHGERFQVPTPSGTAPELPTQGPAEPSTPEGLAALPAA